MRAGISFLLAMGLILAAVPVGSVDRDPEVDPEPAIPPSLAAARKAVEEKDFAAAVRHLEKAAGEAPENADVHNLLGYGYRHLGQFGKSLKHYQIALRLDPRHRGAHEYIGELYLQMGQLENAEKHLEALSNACFWGCKEYDELKEAIEEYKSKRRAQR